MEVKATLDMPTCHIEVPGFESYFHSSFPSWEVAGSSSGRPGWNPQILAQLGLLQAIRSEPAHKRVLSFLNKNIF